MEYNREDFKLRAVTREIVVEMFRGNPDISVGPTEFHIRAAYDEKINAALKNLRGYFSPKTRTWRVPLGEFVGVVRLIRVIALKNTESDFSGKN